MDTEVGRKILAEHPGTTGSLGCAISEAVEAATTRDGYRYVLGSVLNQVLLHQSIIGMETKAAVADADERYASFSASGGLGGADLSFDHMLGVIRKLDEIKNEPGEREPLWLMQN